MSISTKEYRTRIIVISLQSRFDVFSTPVVQTQFETLLAEGMVNFVINLSDTSFIDSAGMATLVTLLKRARAGGGDVRLIWPEKDAARRILTLTRFDRVFGMADTVEAAVGSFKISTKNTELRPVAEYSTEQLSHVVSSRVDH